MKFQVTDKREAKEGLIMKKSIFLGNVKVEFEEDEKITLLEMAKEKDWKMYPVGVWPLPGNRSIDLTVKSIADAVKKQGFWDSNLRCVSVEEREHNIQTLKEMALKTKAVIYSRIDAMSSGDDDVVEEL